MRNWNQTRRILCIRLDAMGDVLMTGPALEALAEAGKEITLLTSPSGYEAARLMPWVSEVITAKVPWMKHPESPLLHREFHELTRRLQDQRYDAAVIFTVYSQSALPAAMLAFQAHIPLRLGHCRENPYHLLSDWVPECEPASMIRHEVRRQLDLVEEIVGPLADRPMRVSIGKAAFAEARGHLSGLGDDWYLLHPGASAASRRYPAGHYAKVIRQLHETTGLLPVLTGSAAETELIETIVHAAEVPVRNLAGQLDLPTLAALIAAAPLVISNNTGPAHLAAALHTPLVCPYAQTNPQHTPWMARSRVLSREVPCQYCYHSVCTTKDHPCLTKIPPEEIVSAALSLLQIPYPVTL